MTIRLTLALLVLPLIPFQDPSPFLCKKIDPPNIGPDSHDSCINEVMNKDRFCNVTSHYSSPTSDGECLTPKDCNWFFTVTVDKCISGVASATIPYFTGDGKK